MSGKNSLANKKRKKIKFDATSGSISGFLLSSSESVDVNISSDNSIDSCDNLTTIKTEARLSTEFDDSFDLFTSKLKKKPDEESETKINGQSLDKRTVVTSPAKNGASPRGRKKCAVKNTVEKSDYFTDTSKGVIPCPFCFKCEEDIYFHISTDCNKPPNITDSIASQLIDAHCRYWKKRRSLGIPGFSVNQDDVFKSNVVKEKQDIKQETSSDFKQPILKWNSKSKKSKYSLLKQSQAERENKITQKLALVLMGCESGSKEDQLEDSDFKTLKRKSICSDNLKSLSAKDITFWTKSSIRPEEASEDIYYVKALAPSIAPKANAPLASSTISNELNEVGDIDDEVAAISSSANVSSGFLPCSPDKSNKENSQTKDSCFSDISPSYSVSNTTHKSEKLCNRLSKNWEKLYNTSDLSDTTVLFSDGSFLAHSIVFYAHSMKIFRSISSSSDEESAKLLDWTDVSNLVGRAYIKYIYCGDVNGFKPFNQENLESVLYLCDKYEEFELRLFVQELLKSKEKHVESFQNRNLTSPDLFDEDVDELNFTVTEERVNASALNSSGSKRKSEGSPELFDRINPSKRVRTEDDESKEQKSKEVNSTNNDDVVSISSDDRVSVSSAVTMSPARYEKLVARPLSQCSTLPPLSESPKAEENVPSPSSPLLFPNSPEQQTRIKDESPVEISEHSRDMKSPGNHLYYDNDTFDYNNYINNSWTEADTRQTNSNGSTLPEGPEKDSPHFENSLDKYFDDSLPLSIIQNSLVNCKTPLSVSKKCGSPSGQSTPTYTPNKNNLNSTSSPQIIVSDKVTPMLNYSNIISPELKGELRKYGLKPDMDRKKAKSLLHYIYDMIHPIVPQEGNKSDASDMDFKRIDEMNLSGDNDESDLNVSRTTTESIVALDEEYSDTEGLSGEYNFESFEELPLSQNISSYLNKNELSERVSSFIKNDPVLHEAVVTFVPIWLDKFHQSLKENSIKCTKIDLMTVLDEMCVTFRTEKKVEPKKKRRSKTKR